MFFLEILREVWLIPRFISAKFISYISYLLDFFLFPDDTLLKAVAISLNDFSSFDQMSPIAYLLEVL